MNERAASYTRVSSTQQEQEGTSLGSQAEAIVRYVKQRGYELTPEHTYQDVWTGSEYRERPGLTALRQAIRTGELDVLIFYALDRLSRNQTHLAVIVDEAEAHGVRLECITEEWDESAVGKAIRNLRAFAAETEREKLIERISRGRLSRLQSGKMLPGKRPVYGYQWTDEKHTGIEPDDITAPVVQRIFTSVAAGTPARSMAKQLTTEGVPTPTGNTHWAVCTITSFLRNETYTGTYRARRTKWQKEMVKDTNGLLRNKRVQRPRPEDEHIIFQVPSLVSSELADAAVARLSHNRTSSTRNNRNPKAALLRGGYARCAFCGCALDVANTGKKQPVYRCGILNRDRHGCKGQSVGTHILDAWVWEQITIRLNDPDLIAHELDALQQTDPTEPDTTVVDRLLSEVKRKQGNLVKRLADVDDDMIANLIQSELSALAEQVQRLQVEREALLLERESWRLAQDRLIDLKEWCERWAENLDDLDYEGKRQLLYALGVEVRVGTMDHDPRFELKASIPLLNDDIVDSSFH